jgi:hypothetical protein
MSVAGANQVDFGTPIGACNNNAELRVYFQAIWAGIRESTYEGAWGGGQTTLVNAKLPSPIAVTSKGLTKIRIYYLSTDNKLCEHCFDEGKGWYAGSLNSKGFVVAPYSKIGACFLATADARLRIYAQGEDNTIQEYCYDSDSSGWVKGTNLGGALPGTHIASTSFTGPKPLSIRTYYQGTNFGILEKAWDGGWATGALSIPNAPPRCSIAVTNFNASSSGVSLRVYYAAANNIILEKGYDTGSWYDGGFKQTCIPGSKVAAISWGGGSSVQIRVYFQNGTQDSAITEWCWSGGWVAGKSALPPA